MSHNNSHYKKLIFYYSDSDTVSNVSTFTYQYAMLENISGNITDKSITSQNYKTIGHFTENKMCNPTTDNNAYVINFETFILNNGTIQIQPAGIQTKNSQGYYGLPANITKIFKIINGTDKFLNAKGYVVLKTYDNLERKAIVLLKKITVK